jgi:dihydrodipicolinate synthase/N-acetylneuraminate lyase
MPPYAKPDARTWAREHLVGVSGATIPSFSADLARLNANGIAHDVDLLLKLGYDYTLVMSEVNITPEENAEFTAICKATAGDSLGLFFHAAFGTLNENIKAVQLAEKAGADLVLLSYPPQFWPTSLDEIYDYTRSFCEATSLGVMLFPIPLWGFERIHPAGMPVSLIRKMIDTIPNVVAIKAEQGYPQPPGIAEMYHHFRDEVVISHPIESQCLPLMSVMDLQFSGTSNTQWMSDFYPTAFNLARSGEWEKAMEMYWNVQPARAANDAVGASYVPGINVLNRTSWKYQDWLAGFNGGPLRQPAMRIPDRFMKQLRGGLHAAKLPCTDLPDSEYMIGLNPC